MITDFFFPFGLCGLQVFHRGTGLNCDLPLFQCDGVNITQKIQDLKLHCLVILNIPR